MNKVKALLIDIETSPLISYTWGLWDQNVSLNQIHTDWHLLSFSAKWLGDKPSEIIYADQRNAKNVQDDKELLKKVWKLLDEADVVIGQNSKAFDIKKLNARFILNGMQPPSSFKQIDTLSLARKHFNFTSNKLEYLSNSLCNKYKKLKTKKYVGFELWKACLAGNKEAWNEMKAYNKMDVLSLEELYYKLIPWDSTLDFNLYTDSIQNTCSCGKSDFRRKGFAYTSSGRYQRLICKHCGAQTRENVNLLSKDKKKSLTKKA